MNRPIEWTLTITQNPPNNVAGYSYSGEKEDDDMDKTRLKSVIAAAIRSYAEAEMVDSHYHDSVTPQDTLNRLISESEKIAGYAMANLTPPPPPPQITDTEKFALIQDWMHPGLWSALDGRRSAIIRILRGERVVPPHA